MADRREALKIIGAISVSCAFPFSADELYGQHAHTGGLVQVKPLQPTYFQADDLKLLSRVADLIIPETDSPSASAAGVPGYIDYVVARNAQHKRLFADGLAWLNEHGFLGLPEPQQLDLLLPLCEAADRQKAATLPERFFAVLKSLTADGYYTSQAGLMKELGYKGNTVLAAFPDCTHEH